MKEQNNISSLELRDIIDAPALQALMENFHQLVEIPIGILDTKGEVLVGVGWQDVCTRFHRQHPQACRNCVESDTELTTGIGPGEFRAYKCKNGLWDVATPIVVGGKHLGNLFIGQFFYSDENPEYAIFRRQAEVYGFDEEQYLAAVERVPRLSRETVNAAMRFFLRLAEMISKLSHSNLSLAGLLAEHQAAARELRDSRLAALNIMDDMERTRNLLQESEADLSRAQEVSHTGSWRLDVSRNELTWSVETYRMFGLPQGTLLTYEIFLSSVHPQDRDYVNAKWNAALKDGFYDIEHRIVVDGRVKWVREVAELELDEQGKLLGGFGTVQDITVRKEGEEALAREKANLQTIFEVVHVGLLLIDEKGVVRRVNDTVSRWLGKDPKLCCGGQPGDVFNCIHALENNGGCGTTEKCAECPIRTTFESVLLTGRPIHDVEAQANIRVNGKDTSLWLEISVDPLTLDGKKHAIIAMNNISSRKLAERALHDSETKYRIIADNNYAFEFWLNPQGEYIYASPSCKKVTGYTPEDFLKDPEMRIKIVHPDDVELVKRHIKDTENEKGGELEFRIIHKDGRVRWVSHVCLPIYDGQGVYLGIRGGNRDITNRKHAEEALQRSNENLEQFAYVASHDLQEPLRIMGSYSQLLEQRYKGKLGKDADDFIHFIVDAAKRMQKLITDLLSYSRAGRMEEASEEIDCNAILGKVLYNLGPVIEESGAVITYDPMPSTVCNETSFIQLFQNLVGNAIKFRKENEKPHIHISARKQGADWLFSVRDNGIGMEEKYREKIFLIFQRLHGRDKYPGTGIGLSICKKIVEFHGGRIWVESDPGRGSTFYFTVPASPVEEEWREN